MADRNPAAEATKTVRPNVSEVDTFGFEPAKVMIEKVSQKEREKDKKRKNKNKNSIATAVEAATEAATAAMNRSAEHERLCPDESLCDAGMSRRWLHSIVEGWV
jgi:hypothetical protein